MYDSCLENINELLQRKFCLNSSAKANISIFRQFLKIKQCQKSEHESIKLFHIIVRIILSRNSGEFAIFRPFSTVLQS